MAQGNHPKNRRQESRFSHPSNSRSSLIKRTSITLDDRVYEAGLSIAAQRGFSQSFSAYIAWLIQRDAAGGVIREDAPKASKPKAPARPAKAARTKAKPAPKAKKSAPAARKRSKTSR